MLSINYVSEIPLNKSRLRTTAKRCKIKERISYQYQDTNLVRLNQLITTLLLEQKMHSPKNEIHYK